MRNILCKLPAKARPGLRRLIQKAFSAQSHKSGLEQAQAVVGMYREQFPEVAALWFVAGSVVLRQGWVRQSVLPTLVWAATMPSWTAPAKEPSLP